MSEQDTEPQGIIMLLPVDTTGLPEVAGVSAPTPSIEHTLIKCDICEKDCWIGPAQLVMRKARAVPAVCYHCLVRGMRLGYIDPLSLSSIRMLNPNADEIPRRT